MNQESRHDLKEKIRQRYKGGDTENMRMIPARPKESIFDEFSQKRVCAYCRVSTDDPRQTSSYELQKNHYEEFIKEDAAVMFFDLYEPEVRIRLMGEDGGIKTLKGYPAEWAGQFGLSACSLLSSARLPDEGLLGLDAVGHPVDLHDLTRYTQEEVAAIVREISNREEGVE